MDIDAVIAEGQETIDNETNDEVIENPVVEESKEEETPEAVEVEETEVAESESEEEVKEGDTPFPKKAVNALSKKNKTITKLKARLEEMEKAQADFVARRDEVKQPQQEALDADRFETYDEYIKALVEQQTKATTIEQVNESHEAALKQQTEAVQQEYQAVRNEQMVEQTQGFMESVPDARELLAQHGHVFDAMPDNVAQLFYEIDNAPAAAYVLAKEGKLQNLARMPFAVAAAEIVRAQDKFEQYKPKPKQTTNAPAPIRAAKAKGGSSSKGLADMSTDELMKWSAGR